MDDLILEEANFLSRNYSELRSKSKKWKVFSKVEVARNPIQRLEQGQEMLILVSRDSMKIDAYKPRFLHKRSELRRNTNLFKSVTNIWEIINPFHLPTVSDKVYKRFYTSVYKAVVKDTYEENHILSMVETDFYIDFSGLQKNNIGFSSFFDGFFELIDCNTRSLLSSEYCHMAKVLYTVAEEIEWGGVSLHSKLHVNASTKQAYHPWMVEILKNNQAKQTPKIPKMLKTPLEVCVSPRLLFRKKKGYIDKENFNLRKIEKIMTERMMKKFKPDVFQVSTKNLRRIKSQDRKALTFYSNYLDKISPLSTLLTTSRSKEGILESVIDGRKKNTKRDTTTFSS